MWVQIGLAASGGVTLLATNLDNLAVLVPLLLTKGRTSALAGFLGAQLIVLAIAAGFAEGAEITFSSWTGYLGVIPLALGLWGLWGQWKASEGSVPAPRSKGTILAYLVLFLGLSTDSLAVFAPLLADTLPGYRISVLIGAGMALVGLGTLALALSASVHKSQHLLARLERLGPYAMIAVGLYVLSNTATDAV
ncbi:hypothetical protein [uncultured Shimia sp.]|uniref:hypothetical protein n=1 Tax=uncultured Shimia sp. TaxID=573152 RepID=UPI00260DF83B|nr:hypothetical protein [uncultured Shimia sp.]